MASTILRIISLNPKILPYILSTKYIRSKKTESLVTKNEEQSEQLAMKIQEMQSALQKAAVEAAKAAAQQAA